MNIGTGREPSFELKDELELDLPIGPLSTLDFIKDFRPMIGRSPQNFVLTPFWIQPLEDNHPNKMFVNARQTYKTTNSANILMKYAIAYPGAEVTYVADDQNHLTAFSEQRLRAETILANDSLRRYLPGGRMAAVGRIKLLNGTYIWLVTDENKYHAVEGHSNRVLIFDEAQAHDAAYETIAMYSLSATHGDFYRFGIGGEEGSEYHKRWERTDQHEWIYDDASDYKDPSTGKVWPGQGWRNKLRIVDGNILNTPEELKTILAGRWVPQKPENKAYRGYHMSQDIFPTIPLTIHDAIHLYNTHQELSVEYQLRYYPHNISQSHTLGLFYRAEHRPITPADVMACYTPNIRLLTAEEVRQIKGKYQNAVRVLGGVDFGSHPKASETIRGVVIHWRKSGRYQLASIRKVSTDFPGDQPSQARAIAEDFGPGGYNVDFAVGDIGYGEVQIPLIQNGGYDSNGNYFEGLGKRRFQACQTYGDPTKPELEFKTEVDEHGKVMAHIRIDKTTVLQNFVDFIKWKVPHPEGEPQFDYDADDRLPKLITKFAIPMYRGREYETDWLIDEFCDLTRKDLDPEKVEKEADPRQRAKKEFNHPRDATMCMVYNLVADSKFDEDRYTIMGTRKKR